MASSSTIPRFYLLLFFLISHSAATTTLTDQHPFPFSFNNFTVNSTQNFISLYGDANIVNVDKSIKNNGTFVGLVLYNKPFKLFGSKPRKNPNPISFSTDFTFSLSSNVVAGVAFVVVDSLRKGSIYMEVKVESGNYVVVNADGVYSKRLISDLGVGIGEKMRLWIDYQAISKRLEVRLSKLGYARSYKPLISCPIDLGKWKNQVVVLGLRLFSGSGNGNLPMTSTSLYSWRFKQRIVPSWMHSQPVNPRVYSVNHRKPEKVHKKRVCSSKVVGVLLFAAGIGAGALASFVALILWAVFDDWHTVIELEHPKVHSSFRYEKIDADVEKI
ncbi:Legume lectin domain [Dillenia turbinata]|uniref:Legume lectin domain n=1 Tax=Dillenia turbinata TaxID=194707 RepID=A0AAN8V9R7_9MAGN